MLEKNLLAHYRRYTNIFLTYYLVIYNAFSLIICQHVFTMDNLEYIYIFIYIFLIGCQWYKRDSIKTNSRKRKIQILKNIYILKINNCVSINDNDMCALKS